MISLDEKLLNLLIKMKVINENVKKKYKSRVAKRHKNTESDTQTVQLKFEKDLE